MGFFRSEPIAFYKNKAGRIAALRVCLGAGSVVTILSFGHMCTGLSKERSKQGTVLNIYLHMKPRVAHRKGDGHSGT